MSLTPIPSTSAGAAVLTKCRQAWWPTLLRLATACGAVIGLSAMASQGVAESGLSFEDGLYLYGESPVAATVGSVYFVFRVEADRLTGAVYQPASSFDCVYGRVGEDLLHLTLVDAYDQTESPYTVAMTPIETAVASTQGVSLQPHLEGMHALSTLSELDHRLLATCRQ